MGDLFKLCSAENSLQAGMIKSRLEEAGIISFVKFNDASGTMPHLQVGDEIEVFVNHPDAERAKEILKELA